MADTTLVHERLARSLVEAVAPQELAFFDYNLTRYRKNPELSSQLMTEERQAGAGLGTDGTVVTLVVLTLLQPIVSAVAAGVTDAIKEVTKESLKPLLKPHADKLVTALRDRRRKGAPPSEKEAQLEKKLGELAAPGDGRDASNASSGE